MIILPRCWPHACLSYTPDATPEGAEPVALLLHVLHRSLRSLRGSAISSVSVPHFHSTERRRQDRRFRMEEKTQVPAALITRRWTSEIPQQPPLPGGLDGPVLDLCSDVGVSRQLLPQPFRTPAFPLSACTQLAEGLGCEHGLHSKAGLYFKRLALTAAPMRAFVAGEVAAGINRHRLFLMRPRLIRAAHLNRYRDR